MKIYFFSIAFYSFLSKNSNAFSFFSIFLISPTRSTSILFLCLSIFDLVVILDNRPLLRVGTNRLELARKLARKPASEGVHGFPCKLCLPPWVMGLDFLDHCKRG